MTAVVWGASRQAGARLQLLPLSGHLSLGALQISLAFTSRVSGWLPPDLAAKPFNHRLPRRWTRSYVGDGRGPLIPIKVITQATATPGRPFIPWNRPISPVSILLSRPADPYVREPSPTGLVRYTSDFAWVRMHARGCCHQQQKQRWSQPLCLHSSLYLSHLCHVEPHPERLLWETWILNFQLLKICNHLHLTPTPTPPHPAPTSELPCLNLKGCGGVRERDWWINLLIHCCRQKEEKIDWTLMRIISRGCAHLQPWTHCMRLGVRSPVHMYDLRLTVIQS